MDVGNRSPPSGAALDDHATRVLLRRYRFRPWLFLIPGVVLLGEVVAATVYDLWDPVASSLDNVITIVTVVSLFLGPALVIVGLGYLVRVRRWRRVLAEHAWRAVRYVYSERTIRSYTPDGTISSEQGQLVVYDPPGGTSPHNLRLDGWTTPWDMRRWRQAPEGVAWIAGDLSGALVVVLPGPERLFGARGGIPWLD